MNESKIEATDRLRREGRWHDGSVFRDETRRRLRAEGMSRKAAGEAAWLAMAEKFAPLPEPAVELVPKSVFEGKPNIPIAEAVEWALGALCMAGIRPEDSPSAAAWTMRRWAASSNRSERIFFSRIVPKFLVSQDAAPRDGARLRDHQDDVDEYSRMMGFLDEDMPAGSRRSSKTADARCN